MAQTIQERRDQFHTRFGEALDSFDAAVVFFLDQACAVFLQQTGESDYEKQNQIDKEQRQRVRRPRPPKR